VLGLAHFDAAAELNVMCSRVADECFTSTGLPVDGDLEPAENGQRLDGAVRPLLVFERNLRAFDRFRIRLNFDRVAAPTATSDAHGLSAVSFR
jgi:hypothetical protein